MTEPPPEPARRLVEGIVGRVDAWEPVRGGWRVAAGDRRAFAKAALDAGAVDGLRNECAVLLSVASPHLPVVLGAHVDGPDVGVLVLEDLTGAAWPPPWPDDLSGAVEALRSLHAQPVPERLVPFGDLARRGWAIVDVDPALADEAWLARALPALRDAEARVRLAGTELVHGALEAERICFAGDRVVVVGWADAGAGNGARDLAALALAARLGGGPALDVPDAGGWAAHLAADALLAGDEERARAALAWACEELELPPPPDGR